MAKKKENKKQEITAYNVPPLDVGDKCVCPICKVHFTVTEDTKFLVGKEFACSWRCAMHNHNK